ncbi:MAG: PEGA domain-containing protein [Pseudomonadota bacterium]
MRSLTSGFLVALLTLALVHPADAKRRKTATTTTPFVVLLRLDKSVPELWEAELQSTALAAAAQRPNLQWMPPPQVSLEETRMLLGCPAWDAACVAQIGETLGAGRALYVELVINDTVPVLQVLDVDVKHSDKAKLRRIELPDLDATGQALAKAHVRGTIQGLAVTTLAVRSEPPGVVVTLDGKMIGAAPLARIEGFSAGSHALYFTREGYEPQEQQVVVQKGQALLVRVALKPMVVAVAVPPPVPDTAAPTSSGTNSMVATTTEEDSGDTVAVETDESPPPPIERAPYPHWDSIVAWTGVGVGALVMVGGGALYGAHQFTAQPLLKAEAEFKDTQTVTSMTQVQYAEAKETSDALYIASLVSAGVGALLALSGSTLLFVPPPSE